MGPARGPLSGKIKEGKKEGEKKEIEGKETKVEAHQWNRTCELQNQVAKALVLRVEYASSKS